jgi:hypothetical protein
MASTTTLIIGGGKIPGLAGRKVKGDDQNLQAASPPWP